MAGVLPDIFHAAVAGHVLAGATGAVAFWVPVIAKKGGAAHRRWGDLFVASMLAVGTCAVVASTCTILDPVGTHLHLVGRMETELVRDIFGWMMLYLAVLTINLAWYGKVVLAGKRDRTAAREWRNLALQGALAVTTTICAVLGLAHGQVLMIGISTIGFATVATNLWFLYGPERPDAWLKEHLKGLVGAGISVYTAFFAFGAVRTFPALALNPVLWAVPLTVGIGLILWHWRQVDLKSAARRRTAPA